MSLDWIIQLIIDNRGTASPYMRAINLFEFQIAVTDSKSFDELVVAEKINCAPSKLLQTARIFAAIRFLETIESKLRERNAGNAVSIKQYAEDRDYQMIFDDVIARNGGWRRIRHSPSVRSFDRKIISRFEEAEAVAKYIDFSYRYDKYPITPHRIGGITAAKYVVRTATSFGAPKMKRTKSKDLWSEFDSAAPFLYLLLIQDFPLKSPRVGSETFSDDLLKQAEDVATLRRFFRAYQHLCEVLNRQGYDYDIPRLDINCDIPQLKADAFEDDAKVAFGHPEAKSGA
jgi:hypothetical protein